MRVRNMVSIASSIWSPRAAAMTRLATCGVCRDDEIYVSVRVDPQKAASKQEPVRLFASSTST